MASICLAMIVKNESHIIVETLRNVCAAIRFATWQISDTGSTDGTQGLIRDFFAGLGLSGELTEDAWVDFGTNRTLVFQKAYQKTDYVLVWDADDRVHGTLVFPTPMDADEYGFRFQSGAMCFRRTQLFNNRKRWKYTGVLHEYAECLDPRQPYRMIEGDYYFAANSLGARALDPDKYAKDAAVLEAACVKAEAEKNPIAARYAFYCANSYRNTTNRDKTIEFYKKVLTMSGWNQEKYMACLELWGQHELLGVPEKGVEFLMESTKYDRTRVECVYRLVKYYGCKELFEPAVACYSMIQEWFETRFLSAGGLADDLSSRLFAKTDEYDFYLPYYMIIMAEKTKRYALGAKMYEIVWKRNYQGAGEWWMGNVVHNLQFFTESLKGRGDLLTAFDTWSATIKVRPDLVLSDAKLAVLSSTREALSATAAAPTEPQAWKPTADEWIFCESHDSLFGDIRSEGRKAVPDLMAVATSNRSCVAFNTHGWLKSSVTFPLRKCLTNGDGVYVRKSTAAVVNAAVDSESPWVFYPFDDSFGGDIRKVKASTATAAATVDEIQAAAEAEPLCVAFNTLGWLKSAVTFPLRKTFTSTGKGKDAKGANGLYVKRGTPLYKTKPDASPHTPLRPRVFADAGIDAVLYINLEHRRDRKEGLLEELQKAGVPEDRIHRVDAIRNVECGNLGCSQSHTKALDEILKNHEWRYVAVLEDDFVFRDAATVWTEMGDVLAAETPDVLLLGHNPIDFQFERTGRTNCVKVLATSHRTGYVISATYAPTLKANFERATAAMSRNKETMTNPLYHGDIVWKELHPKDKWLSIEPALGKQRDGYSDCEKNVLTFQF